MKKIATIFCFFCCCSGYAQTPQVFKGGIGDGIGKGNYTQNSIAFQTGGEGDGWTNGLYAQNSISFWKGGEGDGWHKDNYTQNSISFWKGGEGDGWHKDNYTQNSISFWKGGIGDGWAKDSVMQQSVDIWSGGIGDGWASTYIPLSALPVNMLSFTGVQLNKQHFLKWSTSSETNTDYFDVERSPNNSRYTFVGKVNAAGFSTTPKNYYLTDASPLPGNNFYRLKMFDKDGQFKYSNIVLLKVLKDKTSVAIFPNPTASLLNIQLSGDTDGSPVYLTVFDVQGKRIYQNMLKKDNLAVQVDVSKYPAGTYTLNISNNAEQTTIKFIKQ